MTKYDDLLAAAVAGYREIAAKSEAELHTWLGSQPRFPPNITVNGAVHFITSEGLNALREFGALWYVNNPLWRPKVSERAVIEATIASFGALLSAGSSPSTAALFPALQQRLVENLRTEHFYFAAHVFEQLDVETISVGPVLFHRRRAWIALVQQRAGRRLDWMPAVSFTWSQYRADWKWYRDWLRFKVLPGLLALSIVRKATTLFGWKRFATAGQNWAVIGIVRRRLQDFFQRRNPHTCPRLLEESSASSPPFGQPLPRIRCIVIQWLGMSMRRVIHTPFCRCK
jgi:hypothetical protein